MLKVRIVLLFILCFCLIGCNDADPTETVFNYPLETMVVASSTDEVIEFHNKSEQDFSNSTASISPDTSAYNDEQIALIEQLRALPEYFPQWYGDIKPETGTVFSVTVKEKREENGEIQFVYHNEQLDFADLKLSVLAFDPSSETEALRLSVTVPKSWSEKTIQWFFEDGMRLNFMIGERHVDAFRKRIVSPSYDNTYEIIYKCCVLDEYDLSADSLIITPYVREASLITLNSYTTIKDENGNDSTVPVSFHLGKQETAVERCNTEKQRIKSKYEDRHYLNFASVKVPLLGTHIVRPSLNVILPVEVEDYVYSESLGLMDPNLEWHDDPKMQPRGILYGREKDFNQVSVVVDAFRIHQDETELVVSYYFPDDWTDAECNFFCRRGCMLEIFLDDVHPNFNEPVTYPYSDDTRLIFALTGMELMEEQNHFATPVWKSWNWREKHFVFRSVSCSVKEWKNVHSITIVPSIIICNTELPENGIPYGEVLGDLSEILNEKTIGRWVPELAITIEITEDLFDSGL